MFFCFFFISFFVFVFSIFSHCFDILWTFVSLKLVLDFVCGNLILVLKLVWDLVSSLKFVFV